VFMSSKDFIPYHSNLRYGAGFPSGLLSFAANALPDCAIYSFPPVAGAENQFSLRVHTWRFPLALAEACLGKLESV
jgi:hypothetical protein